MNQERFDDLTRVLATGRLSRRQVLKSAAGVLLAGPLGALWNSPASAQGRCASDPMTATSVAAARTALAAGAKEVKLSPQGCVRYRRTVVGGRITHEETTFASKPALVWKHTPTKSIGRRDLDLDGFFEWRATTQRGPTATDSRTRISEFAPANGALVRRETYARTGIVVHTRIEEADASGVLRVVAEFDMGLKEFAQFDEARTEVQPRASSCSPDAQQKIQAALKRAFTRGTDCLNRLGAPDLAKAIDLVFARNIKIHCLTLPPGKAAKVNGPEVRADPKVPVTIIIDMKQFSTLDDVEQAGALWHEMSHIELGPGSKDHNSGHVNVDADRVYACQDICFDHLNATKCQCALCMQTTISDKRCFQFHDCRGEFDCPPGQPCQCNGSTCKCEQGTCQSGPQPGNKIYCNCNKKCYDDAQVCLSECKATLGCFTGICEPAQPGQCPP